MSLVLYESRKKKLNDLNIFKFIRKLVLLTFFVFKLEEKYDFIIVLLSTMRFD